MKDADPDADAIAATKAIREGMAEQEQVEAADQVPIDLSLGEDYESHSPYDDHIEPPGITEDDYFALPPEERMEIPRGAQGRPIGYWSWSKEAWGKYHRENPRQTEYEPLHKRHHNGRGEGENKGPPPPPTFSRIINPGDWEGLPVPEREAIVLDYIPHKTVTLFSGDGGTGKSLLTLQLAVGRALAREWIGLMPEPGRTLILSAEDDADEMHRRLDDIRKFYRASFSEIGKALRLIDLVGEDSILGMLMKGQIMPTPMYAALDTYMAEWQPNLIALDVLADVFSGDENSRPQARQFVGLLKKLCLKHSSAVLLLAHPSLTGLNTGTGTSGSTGWNNSVRSRLYFQTAKASDGSEPNKNLRTIEGMKHNYGERGGKIDLEWKSGLFVPVKGLAGFDKIAREQRLDEKFMSLLKRLTAQNRPVRATTSRTGAPSLFATEPDNGGFTAKDFEAAMLRLLGNGKIANELETEGPPSRRNLRLVIKEGTSK